MRVAISVDNAQGLDSVVSPHFGRCPHYALVDIEGQEIRNVQVVANPFHGRHQPGQVPAFIRDQGAHVMLTGSMGARAMGFFDQYGIEPVTGAVGTVRHALQQYLSGALSGAAACGASHEHSQTPAPGEYEQDEAGRLREEATSLQQEIDEAIARLTRLLSD